MIHKKKSNVIFQKVGVIFISSMVGILVACSNETVKEEENAPGQSNSSRVEEAVPNDTETKKEEVQEDVLLTHEEFIKRWNQIVEENGQTNYHLNGEIETLDSDEEVFEMGFISISDSYLVLANPETGAIQKVSLNLSYPIDEDPDSPHIHDVTKILMQVLQPTLTEVDLKFNLSELGVSTNDYSREEVTLVENGVTYTINNGDDRFWLDALVEEN
ncbi:hypothetical protein [Metabacillus litoralis]|uniref:hypothetical protein n=1 Tax=Metabacillus litoralis TaxID=152268 RepID=UPI00203EF3A1|nr:hypothetical protein [Metabacillus litoralis]MCM3652971.1 hypothetical protein [Metabacillus litoralis]